MLFRIKNWQSDFQQALAFKENVVRCLNFFGRQCLCLKLQNSQENKPLLELLKSADNPEFLQAACGHPFDIISSPDSCSIPVTLNGRLRDLSPDAVCKNRLLELKNDLCPNPSNPDCCIGLRELAEEEDCACKLSQRKIPGLTQDSFSFFDSLVNDDGFKERCGISIDSIRKTSAQCLEKVDLSLLPNDTVVTSGCGLFVQKIVEDVCPSTVKRAFSGRLSQLRVKRIVDPIEELQKFKSDLQNLNAFDPEWATNYLQSIANQTKLVAGHLLKKAFPDEPLVDDFMSTDIKVNVTNFLHILEEFLKDKKPRKQPESLACCQALSDFGVNSIGTCACMAKERDPSLKVSNGTLDVIDFISGNERMLDHCGHDVNTFTTTDRLCNTVLRPTPKDVIQRTVCYIKIGCVKETRDMFGKLIGIKGP